jgi:predicted PurR-regulated permease PerM
LSNPWVRAVGALLVLVLVVLVGYGLSAVLVPLALAFLVAYIFDPIVDFFEARRVPRIATIAVLAVLALLLIVSIPLLVVPSIISQADSIIHSKHTEAGGLNQWLEETLNSPRMDRFMREIGWVDPDAPHVDTLDVVRRKVGEYVRTQSVQLIRANASSIAAAGRTAGATLYDLFASVGNKVLGIVLSIGSFVLFGVVAAFMLKDFDQITSGARQLIPPRYAPKTLEILSKIDLQLRSFLRGQTAVCLCVASIYTIGFLVSGLQAMAVMIGGVAVFLCFVPFLGHALISITALIMVVLQYGLDWHVLGVLATMGIVQALEGNVLVPKIVGDQVGLSPVWVILAIMVFGNVLGLFGLLIAVPTAAALKVLVVEAVAYYKRSPIFEGGGPS